MRSSLPAAPPHRTRGFTLIEVLVVVVVVGLLASLAVGAYANAITRTRNTRAMVEIRNIERAIAAYRSEAGVLPADLNVIRFAPSDPWGTPYVYLNFDPYRVAPGGPVVAPQQGGGSGGGGNGGGNDRAGGIAGVARKDRFLVPLNTDYDLYSCGADRDSKKPLQAPQSWDDIIRAADGAFVGLAADF